MICSRYYSKLNADPCLTNIKPFANITSHSQFPDEREILFMTGSVFRLDNIREDQGINIIHLTLVSEEEHDLNHLFARIRKEIGGEK